MCFCPVYLIDAEFDEAFAQRVARQLLADPVCQDYFVGRSNVPVGPAEATLVEVHLKSGVTDPAAESVLAALRIWDLPMCKASARPANMS
jgi:phosphoribosylformylglycinamidine (FGAM) synthase PurS component